MRSRRSRTPWQAWSTLSALTAIALATALAAPVAAQDFAISSIASPAEVKGAPVDRVATPNPIPPGLVYAPTAQGYLGEVEPNGTTATASPIVGTNLVIRANLFPNGDIDFYSFTGAAGDKVYLATMTSFSASSTDSQITVLGTDGTTVLEFDDDNGTFAGFSSSIAGVTLPGAGTFFIKINDFTAGTVSERPYELHFRLQSGSPTPEVESNDTPATANPLPANGWVSGTRDPALATEQDWYSMSLSAGDTVFLSLDVNPERDATVWNGRLGIALFGDAGNQILVVDDAGTGDVLPVPNNPSEALFMTVKTAGTYYAFVDSASAATGGPTATYTLSVSVHPATDEGVNCTTYTSIDLPQVIGPGASLTSSTITVPGNPRIADVDVAIVLDHVLMTQVDAHLRSPAGNDNGIFTDIGSNALGGQAQMDIVFDDEAGITPGFTVLKGVQYKPELSYRLNWFDGEDAGGTWTLDLRDDVADANGGNLTSWSLRICEEAPAPTCGPGFTPVTVYTTDFETDDAGFTHSGTADEWERGLPATLPTTTAGAAVAAFNSCNSGVNCWKTDLDNTYDNAPAPPNVTQNLLSPPIDLTGLSGPVVVTWAQRLQVESATFDHASVDYQQVGGATPVRLFEWLDATPSNGVGSPTVNIGESSGWARFARQVDSLAGLNTELLFHMDQDNSVALGGMAIDDVSVTACEPIPEPAISMAKTVGLTAGVCGTDETTTVPYGTPVTYCYTVTNTGGVTLNYHTVVDDQLGTVLDNVLHVLAPTDSFFFTVDDVVLTDTTTNNATWTASVDPPGADTICNDPALAIPDNNPTGVNDSIVVGAGANLSDLDVSLNVTHTWVGDLKFTVTDGVTTVAIFDQPGVPASTFGCSSNDVDATLDDAAPDPVESECAAGPPAIFGTFSPNQPLAGFNGAPFATTWTLNASDLAGGDTGVVNEWCLIARFPPVGPSDSDSVTVTVLPQTFPDIAVAPESLSNFQAVDTQTQHQLDITNNGDADLEWEITEDAGLAANPVVAHVPGRQQPILPNHRSTPPEANEPGTGDLTFSRSTTSVAGQQVVPPRGEAPEATVTISHSSSQAIVSLNSASCNAGGFHTDNSYIRSFTLADFGISGAFSVTQVEVGIEQAAGTGGTQPVTVNLYTWNPLDPFTFANFALIGTANALVPDQTLSIITVPVAGNAPAGSTLVVEFFTPSGQPSTASLFVGSNTAPQTAPTFIAAADCGIAQPTDTAAIGFPDMHWVLNVTGTTGCDADLPWVSSLPAGGTTIPGATTPVTVTFDSTGLIPGGVYTGSLCVQSNDPDTPNVLVPLTLEVDGMPFLDGFETGDTSRWSYAAP